MFDHMEHREILPLKMPHLPLIGRWGVFCAFGKRHFFFGMIVSAHDCMRGRLCSSRSER